MSLFLPRFRELLAESGKMQKDICDDLGISKQKLSKWKTGYSEPNFDDIIMLAKYFDVSTDYLLGLSDDLDAPLSSAALDLPADERELLNLYRQLNYEGRQRLIARAEVMIEDAQSLHVKPKKHYIIVKRACQRKKHFRKEVLFLRLWSLIFSGVLSRNNRTPRQRAKSPYHCTAHNSTRARGRLPSSLPATTLAPARTPAPPVQALCP